MTAVVSLLYHDVIGSDFDESGFPGARAALYKLDRVAFEQHLDAIGRSHAGPPARADRLLDGRPAGPGAAAPAGPPLLLTFDDGGVSAHDPIADLLDARGWTGHFFVTTDRIGTSGFLDPDQIRDLHSRGHLIGSHSATHPAIISALPPDRLLAEWRDSTHALADILGEPVRLGSVPGGYLSSRVAEAAALAGIEILFTSEPLTRTRRTPGAPLLLGRFCLRRGDPPALASAFVDGRGAARARQWLVWNSRKSLRRFGGRWYQLGQERILRRILHPR